MLELECVISSFLLLASLEKNTAEKWRSLCKTAAYDIYRRIKKNADIQSNMQRLCDAAGALAFYRYQLILASGDGGSGFKAGDITVNGVSVSQLKLASLVRDESLFSIKDLIDDSFFAFVSCSDDNGV